jgi:hypothetical protein
VSVLGWLLALCLSVDASNPLLPGFVRLDPSQAIQAPPPGSPGHGQPVRTAHLAPRVPLVEEPSGERPVMTRLAMRTRWWRPLAPQPGRHHAGERPLVPSLDDH